MNLTLNPMVSAVLAAATALGRKIGGTAQASPVAASL